MALLPGVDMDKASLAAIAKTTAPPGLQPFVELVDLAIGWVDVQRHPFGVQRAFDSTHLRIDWLWPVATCYANAVPPGNSDSIEFCAELD